VDIKLQTKVDKIHIENGRAAGIVLNGKIIKAKVVLSNGNIRSTILNMVGEEHFPQEFVTKAKNIRLNSSSCQVYMGLKAGAEIPYIGERSGVKSFRVTSEHSLLYWANQLKNNLL
jgi:phytoene dehydrogenase-like protein